MNPVNVSYSTPESVSAPNAGYEAAKRLFDATVAWLLIMALAPVAAVVALAVLLDSPGGVFFAQERGGRYGKPFRLLKFRSMRPGTPSLSTAEMRRAGVSHVTRVGVLLRRTSLDELPQLINVLKGEMSLVGPRPALTSQTSLNAARARSGVDLLLPGITGWAQINGRDELSDEQKVAHDVYYRHHRSFKLDLVILFRTLASVLTGRGNR